jgi:hypothetical protein
MRVSAAELGEWFKLAGTIGGVGALIWGIGRAIWGWLFNDRPYVALAPASHGNGVALRIANPLSEEIIISAPVFRPSEYITTAAENDARDALFAIVVMETDREFGRPNYLVPPKGDIRLAVVRSSQCPETGKVKVRIDWRTTTERYRPRIPIRTTISIKTLHDLYAISELHAEAARRSF